MPTIAAAGPVGFPGYGVGLVLFVRALRHLGSARTSAYFSTAPFFGVTAAIIALGEPVPLALRCRRRSAGSWPYQRPSERLVRDRGYVRGARKPEATRGQ